MVLLEVLAQLAARSKLKLLVAHAHHGVSNREQLEFRDRAQVLVAARAQALGLEYVVGQSDQELRSEADLRRWRMSFFKSVLERDREMKLLLAHHADDLLETRLIRLVRGTSRAGLMAMRERSGRVVRPFLAIAKNELRDYAQHEALTWLEDPSNRDTHALRNWMRESWLPQLEVKRPGSLQSLARSLAQLSHGDSQPEPELPAPALLGSAAHEGPTSHRIELRDFSVLVGPARETFIAEFLRNQSIFEFQTSQLSEICKRLDAFQVGRKQPFTLVGLDWRCDGLIVITRPQSKA
jgi:tRNA(Ile)-lysidine synthase